MFVITRDSDGKYVGWQRGARSAGELYRYVTGLADARRFDTRTAAQAVAWPGRETIIQLNETIVPFGDDSDLPF